MTCRAQILVETDLFCLLLLTLLTPFDHKMFASNDVHVRKYKLVFCMKDYPEQICFFYHNLECVCNDCHPDSPAYLGLKSPSDSSPTPHPAAMLESCQTSLCLKSCSLHLARGRSRRRHAAAHQLLNVLERCAHFSASVHFFSNNNKGMFCFLGIEVL